METLTKENFWNEMFEKYPIAMKLFMNWLDTYKTQQEWHELFNADWVKFTAERKEGEDLVQNILISKAPKFHELPVAMQWGIFLEFAQYTGDIDWISLCRGEFIESVKLSSALYLSRLEYQLVNFNSV